MFSRREFLHAAAALGSSSIAWGAVPDSIAKAMAIDPEPGTTYIDAEHVVILMQENRSFDHAFGTMRGVRGFRDPRPHLLPSGLDVWFQSESGGGIFPPFRMEMDATNVTWIGGTPHSWKDQVDARNGGRYDNWLEAKRRKDNYPMTMGYFTREDIPFYYTLANAFTICDYAFCSSLTGTTANRLYLWSGTIRESAEHPARVQNGDTDYDSEAAWTTYPERLQRAGISWKIYQNEISLGTGFDGEHDAWLANFTDNPIEWFSQYRVRFSETRRRFVRSQFQLVSAEATRLAKEVELLTGESRAAAERKLAEARLRLTSLEKEIQEYNEEAWYRLSREERELHERAFCDNRIDAKYRQLERLEYKDGEANRQIDVPAGDVLAQFRKDVRGGNLPAVSWIVAPERFSDHPGSAWFGAWYISEVISILTENPEVWKKTVFILCYDENDGFFDHIPPFVAPHPGMPETGRASDGIDTREDISKEHGRNHSIGLGYRCPLIIASPWTRGGCVNSQVSDHTSILMFLESWLAGKGKKVVETNISKWRRTICGDLTSAFKPFNGEKITFPKPLERNPEIERIHRASFKERPSKVAPIEASEIEKYDVRSFQEKGIRPSCPLPYELEANFEFVSNGVEVRLEAGNNRFKERAAGGAFNLYSYIPTFFARSYAVSAGDAIEDIIPIEGGVHIRIDGPNGFFRELRAGVERDFGAKVKGEGTTLILEFTNRSDDDIEIRLIDASYGQKLAPVRLNSGQAKVIRHSVTKSQRWYDLVAETASTRYRFAGRIEDGTWSVSDPAMG